MTEQPPDEAPYGWIAPAARLKDMSQIWFFLALFATVTLAVALGTYLFYDFLFRTIGLS